MKICTTKKTETAISGTKHTILTDKNRIGHRKRASKPMNLIVQSPSSRMGENPRRIDGQFTQIERKEEHTPTEQTKRCSTPIHARNKLEMENATLSPVYGRLGRSSTVTPGGSKEMIKASSTTIRKSARLSPANPLSRYGNPITF